MAAVQLRQPGRGTGMTTTERNEIGLTDVNRDVTLLDLLDRILDKGVVLSGDIVLTVADVDLVYVSLRALISSVDTARRTQ
jgi:hypothetical protein